MFKSFYKMAVLTSIASFAVFTSCVIPASSGGNGGNGGNGGGERKIISYIGKKAPSDPKKVGDIVFCDGSATSYANNLSLTDEQKSKAIAVIFYVGKECNDPNDDDNRTLGIALQRCESQCWCKPDTTGCGTILECVQCSASMEGKKNGSSNLLVIKNFFKACFPKIDTDELEYDFAAFHVAKNYGKTLNESASNYKEGWYLPSLAEVMQLHKNIATVQSAVLCSGSKAFVNLYGLWTASQHPEQPTCAQFFSWTSAYDYSIQEWHKGNKQTVLAIREF